MLTQPWNRDGTPEGRVESELQELEQRFQDWFPKPEAEPNRLSLGPRKILTLQHWIDLSA
jgi:hypothetical protein